MSLNMFARSKADAPCLDEQRELPATSLLVPANPAIADPGSPPTSRGGILLNPLPRSSSGGSGSQRSRSASSASRVSSSTGGSSSPGAAYTGGSAIERTTTASSVASTTSNASMSSQTSNASGTYKLKFAPLPESGRKRSSSITLGVASRAAMLAGQTPTTAQAAVQQKSAGSPGWQSQLPNVQKQQQAPIDPNSQLWYNGTVIPNNVKTVKDIKPGLKKAWSKLKRRSSSAGSNKSDLQSDNANDGRTASSDSLSSDTSATSAGSDEMKTDDATSAASGNGAMQRGRPIQRHSSISSQQAMATLDLSEIPTVEEEEEDHAHFGGEETPRRRHSPPPSITTQGSGQPSAVPQQRYDMHPSPYPHAIMPTLMEGGSGGNTPKRSMSMTDPSVVHGPHAHDQHHKAVFGFDEQALQRKFQDLEMHREQYERQHSQQASPDQIHTPHAHYDHHQMVNLPPKQGESDSISGDSEMDAGEDSEEDVPLPDSKQAIGGGREVYEPHRKPGMVS